MVLLLTATVYDACGVGGGGHPPCPICYSWGYDDVLDEWGCYIWTCGNQQCCNGTCFDPSTKGCCNGTLYNLSTQQCCSDISPSYVCGINQACCNGSCCNPYKCQTCFSGECQVLYIVCPSAAGGCLDGGACGVGNYHEEIQWLTMYPMDEYPCQDTLYTCTVWTPFVDENCMVSIAVYCPETYLGCNPAIGT